MRWGWWGRGLAAALLTRELGKKLHGKFKPVVRRIGFRVALVDGAGCSGGGAVSVGLVEVNFEEISAGGANAYAEAAVGAAIGGDSSLGDMGGELAGTVGAGSGRAR
jgi:hypothetical protein